MYVSTTKIGLLLSLAVVAALGTSSAYAETRISTGDRIANIRGIDGAKISGFSVQSSARLGVGTYDVRWFRNITKCAAVITLGNGTTFGVVPGFATAVQRAGSGGTGHFIETRDLAGALSDRDFMIYVACP